MTSTTIPSPSKLIHVARIFTTDGRNHFLYLRKVSPIHFVWYEESENNREIETPVSAINIEEALRLAARHWKSVYFTTINCGFRYNLPERDEHGINALFHQMAASYGSMNGYYYDEEMGNNCYVQNASEEALQLWRSLKQQKRL